MKPWWKSKTVLANMVVAVVIFAASIVLLGDSESEIVLPEWLLTLWIVFCS
jgi:hypothetical protein